MSFGLQEYFERHRVRLLAMVRKTARGVMRFETEDDVMQSIWLRCVREAERVPPPTEDERFLAWLMTLGRREIADRADYWAALKRGSGNVLRLTASDSTFSVGAVPSPAAAIPGPSTFADRREMLVLATRALDVLPPRDRELVQMAGDGVDLAAQAERLGLSYAATQKAGLRALERFKKAFELVRRSRTS